MKHNLAIDGVVAMTNVVSFTQASLDDRCCRLKARIIENDNAHEKVEEGYKAIGRELKALKAEYAPTWKEWETLLETKVGISTGRASELMQIADGRKTVEHIRAATAKRVMKYAKASSLANEEQITGQPRMSSSSPNKTKDKAKDKATKQNDERRKTIKAAIWGGMSQADVVKKFKCSKDTFTKLRKELIDRGHSIMDKPDVAAIKAAVDQLVRATGNLTYSQKLEVMLDVFEHMGITPSRLNEADMRRAEKRGLVNHIYFDK